MVQKTFTYRTTEDFRAIMQAMRGDGGYRRAHSAFLLMVESSHRPPVIQERLAVVRELLPSVQVAGLTCGGIFSEEDSGVPSTDDMVSGCSFCLFDEAEVSVAGYDFSAISPAEAAADLRRRVRGLSAVKGIQLLTAGLELNANDFLARCAPDLDGIPVFGAAGGLPIYKPVTEDNLFEQRKAFGEGKLVLDEANAASSPLAFCDAPFGNGVVAAIFSGEGLHIRAAANFGWQPLGKEMEITETDGPFCIVSIDGKPAASIYETYLNVKSDQYFMENVCEFPMLLIDRPGTCQARVPIRSENGRLYLGADVRTGERLRLTYGNIHRMLDESLRDSNDLHRFSPQGLLLYICGNRNVFLKDAARREVEFFRRVHGDFIWCYGWGEILRSGTDGGTLNSSLVTVGLREGRAAEGGDESPNREVAAVPSARNIIPLADRLIAFLEATTRELKKSSDAKSSFLSNMSHEIRTPINAVLGLDEMILRESTESAIRNYAQDIRSAGRTLLAIINDILDFSKIEAGKLEIIPADYDLSATVTDLVNMTASRAKAKGLDFSVSVDEGCPYRLYGDETRVKQCMLNILTNAIKYTRSGSVSVAISFSRLDESHISLRTRVRDTGIGIKEEDMKKLFSPFDRIEEKRNRAIEGTGLGLSIVNSLLAAMGSRLEVRSVYGEGSDFSFAVTQEVRDWEPVGDYARTHARTAERSAAYSESFQAPHARILVVDDTPMNLTVIRGLLKATRIQIDTAESAPRALQMAAGRRYDVLFIDHLMPKMDGIELLRALRSDGASPSRRSPCVALTANAISGARELYLREGFEDYLSKPVDGRLLEDCLRRYLPEALVLLPGQEGYLAQAQGGQAEGTPSGAEGDYAALFGEAFGIDIASALRNCGGREVFTEAVRNFHGAISGKAQLIEEYAAADDLRNYTVQVHALKSSARLIGAAELSARAARLEQCGNDGNRAGIADGTPALLALYRSYGARLAPLCGAQAQAAAPWLPPISAARLDEALGALREVVEAFDFDSADALVQELEKYSLPDGFAPAFAAIKEKLLAVDQQALLRLLGEL